MTIVKWLKQIWRGIRNSIVQECPPELYACEICHRTECDSEQWLTCQERQKSARFMEDLNQLTPSQIECYYRSGDPITEEN